MFIGVGLVSKEIDKRTLYALLAKPVRRWEFLTGKFAGLVLTLAVNTAAMAVALFLALYYVKHSLERADVAVLVAVYFILLKLALVVALAMLFSCFTTPLLAILFTAGLYVAGLFVEELRGMQAEEIGAGAGGDAALAFLPFTELRKLRRDGERQRTGGRFPGPWCAEHGVCGVVLRDRAGIVRRRFFRGEPEMNSRRQLALVHAVLFSVSRECGSYRKTSTAAAGHAFGER